MALGTQVGDCYSELSPPVTLHLAAITPASSSSHQKAMPASVQLLNGLMWDPRLLQLLVIQLSGQGYWDPQAIRLSSSLELFQQPEATVFHPQLFAAFMSLSPLFPTLGHPLNSSVTLILPLPLLLLLLLLPDPLCCCHCPSVTSSMSSSHYQLCSIYYDKEQK
jgi:hypothetical protein